jgi:dolichol-phosphate mannosyltransferase
VPPLKLSVIIPAHNEEGGIAATVDGIVQALGQASVPYEVLVVEDHSSDGTAAVLEGLAARNAGVRWVSNQGPGGYGYAVRAGLNAFTGDAVCIVMADASDDPADIVKYYRTLEDGYECAFGSRFMKGARVENYPRLKLVMNRIANRFIATLLGLPYNDTTNAFKCFRREVIEGIQPILACHFNLTVELPLKAIVRGYSYKVVATNWYGRTTGVSKLKIDEMGSRYLFIVLYVLLEKWLSKGDYRRVRPAVLPQHGEAASRSVESER